MFFLENREHHSAGTSFFKLHCVQKGLTGRRGNNSGQTWRARYLSSIRKYDQTCSLSEFLPRFIPDYCHHPIVVRHFVQAEPIPRVGRKQRVHFDLIVGAGSKSDQSRDDQIAERRVVIVPPALFGRLVTVFTLDLQARARDPVPGMGIQVFVNPRSIFPNDYIGLYCAYRDLPEGVRVGVDLQCFEIVLLGDVGLGVISQHIGECG